MDFTGYEHLPETFKNAISLYVEKRIAPGSCTQAILSNDLFETINRADIDYIQALPDMVRFINNRLPSDCYGSRVIVMRYLYGS
ncbi:MAG: hypothetical protein ACXW2E_01555 [Nitrososphaeraceae archaeon]